MISHFFAFLGVSALVIVTPGPDTALTIRNALFGGRRGGIFTALGVSTGQATWALFTAIGLATLLRGSQPAFTAIRIAGVCYLLYLGVQAFAGAIRGRSTHQRKPYCPGRVRAKGVFRQGLFSNLSNPKMVVFFISLLPPFSPEARFSGLFLLGLVFSAMTLTWLCGYALAVAKAGDFLRSSRIRRSLDALTGFALVALGLRLATERG